MKKKLIAVAGIIILALVVSITYPVIQRRHDLNETLGWIDQTYNPHEGGEGHGWERHYLNDRLNEQLQSIFASDGGCKVTIRNEISPIGVFEETPTKSSDSFDLRDIDPASIAIRTFDPNKDVFDCTDPEQVKLYGLDCTSGEITFSTRNGATAIKEQYVRTFTKLTGADHEQRRTSNLQKTWLLVDDVQYATRLMKAWKHAIELCGGRPSKF